MLTRNVFDTFNIIRLKKLYLFIFIFGTKIYQNFEQRQILILYEN